jgi:hypothetical protein
LEVYKEVNNIQNLQKIFALRDEEVAVLSRSIETSNELFITGRATYLEILLAQQNALEAPGQTHYKKQELIMKGLTLLPKRYGKPAPVFCGDHRSPCRALQAPFVG